MPQRSDWSDQPCPIARGINVVGDPWTLLILREALSGARRFDEFKRRVGASDNILAARLAAMVADGLLVQRPYSQGDRPRQEYVPTGAAADALPILHAYAAWSHAHRPSPAEEPVFTVSCRTCGHSTDRVEFCDNCGAALAVGNVVWARPGRWQGRAVDLSAGGPPGVDQGRA